ncbi:MAG: hypothetical protein RRY97_04330 [Oscillibacter sp.]
MTHFCLGLAGGFALSLLVEAVSRRLSRGGCSKALLYAGPLLHLLLDTILLLLLFRTPLAMLGAASGLLGHIAVRIVRAFRALRTIGGEPKNG